MRLIAAVIVVFMLAVPSPSQERMKPPEAFGCDRNHLTSFDGEVTQYRRTSSGVSLRMQTDENTRERFHLSGNSEQLPKHFMVDRETFKTTDWKRIEMSASKVRAGMRATVWVCEEPKQTLVDWHPAK